PSQLAREARFIGDRWRAGLQPDALADSAGLALAHRVTLVDANGNVLGDSEFSGPSLSALSNHNDRPEIVEARRVGQGSAQRVSPSEGVEELYVAVDAGAGRIARVSISTAAVSAIV